MKPEIHALYEIHRHQLLLNCTDQDREFIFPLDYIYALDNRMYPYFQESWCVGDDPFVECYQVTKEFMTEVITELDRQWLDKSEQIPTFYELEGIYGREQRFELINIIRYCYLHQGFDGGFYDRILTPTEHPTEASGITREYNASDIYLV